jgi:YbbR domain-containing protein
MVEIFDTRGVKVYTNKLNDGNNKITIDLRKLNNGIYIYKVTVNGEVKKSDKIIVIH